MIFAYMGVWSFDCGFVENLVVDGGDDSYSMMKPQSQGGPGDVQQWLLLQQLASLVADLTMHSQPPLTERPVVVATLIAKINTFVTRRYRQVGYLVS